MTMIGLYELCVHSYFASQRPSAQHSNRFPERETLSVRIVEVDSQICCAQRVVLRSLMHQIAFYYVMYVQCSSVYISDNVVHRIIAPNILFPSVLFVPFCAINCSESANKNRTKPK